VVCYLFYLPWWQKYFAIKYKNIILNVLKFKRLNHTIAFPVFCCSKRRLRAKYGGQNVKIMTQSGKNLTSPTAIRKANSALLEKRQRTFVRLLNGWLMHENIKMYDLLH